jgi:hypothetical protein
MGRASFGTPPSTKTLSLFKVRLHSGYDDGGVYWGTPNNLWHTRDKDETHSNFCRANTRAEAALLLGLNNSQLLKGNGDENNNTCQSTRHKSKPKDRGT